MNMFSTNVEKDVSICTNVFLSINETHSLLFCIVLLILFLLVRKVLAFNIADILLDGSGYLFIQV